MQRIVTTVACLVLVALPHAVLRAQTQQGITAKNEKSAEQADGALNAAYQRLLEKISPAGQSALREAQSTWLHFRDQECEFEALGSTGGSVHPLAILICKERITRMRTAELVVQINCSEGDLTCGHQ
ncbi:putative exported protein precursor [Bradyrhizobium sp. STM 3843]|uniref:lysozyme inhibitor LprI family protein n=1 Tax=Bradyrhizobium sp. STM 3843 TaxID=551947 RepID=UPI000240A8E4|nr:lysozyme inhibitor LprI family protein [Bradyrhizobium sp. STM 3843]CCE04823.1 putative exported protein precursor [Bradyrhizobium sp. STM 3843]